MNQIEDSYPKPFAFLKLGTCPVKTLEPPLQENRVMRENPPIFHLLNDL